MTCPNCHAENPGSARFCTTCGHSLAAGCPSCGADLPEGARFCPNCGHRLQAPEQEVVERKLVTVLFADLTGSTGIGERLDPEQVARLMSTFFDAMRTEIESQGGSVEKFVGDAVVAVFGVPAAHEDDAARALRAAIRMVDRLGRLNKELLPQFGFELRMRIGVNTGDVLARVDPRPGEAMVTGDAVNTAARLEAAASPGQILVAERTVQSVRGFVFAPAGDLLLHGRSTPVTAYDLVGVEAAAEERGIPGLAAPLVGRESEMGLLETILQRTAAERQPNLVTLYGAAGVGKSRLTREFLARSRSFRPAPTVLRGRCLPYGEGVALWPLAEILKDLAGIRESDSPAEVVSRIRELGRHYLTPGVTTDWEGTVAALLHTIGASDPDRPGRPLNPREARARIVGAWRSLFTALGAEAPLIVVVEDIHWADAALLEMLDDLVDRVQGPLMLICPSRPELTDTRPDWGGGRRNHSSVFLAPLSAEESDLLMARLLEIAELPAGLRGRILERAEGNPFFLEEIIRHLIDHGVLTYQDGRWKASGEIDRVVVPDTVQAVLHARIDLLAPAEKATLQRAAVVGRTFWTGPVTRLTGLTETEVASIFDQLESRELIRSDLTSSFEGEPEFTFKHVLTRDVAYESLPRQERAQAHASVAEWIEEATRDQGVELIELVAHHWVEACRAAPDDPGTDPEESEHWRLKALDTSVAASSASLARSAGLNAGRLAEEALALSKTPEERVRALTARGMAALFNYEGDTAWLSFKEAADLLMEHSPEDGRRIARTLARAVETPTRWPGSMLLTVPEEEVRRLIDLGFSQLGANDQSSEMVRLLIAESMLLFSTRKPVEAGGEMVRSAREAAARAEQISHQIGRYDLTSASLDALGAVESSIGDYGANVEVVERRLDLLDRITNPWEVGDAMAMGSWGFGFVGQYRRARELAERGFDLGEREAPGIALHNNSWLAYAEFWLGGWDRIVGELADRTRAILGDRLEDPPYFSGHFFGAETFVHAARRDEIAGQSVEALGGIVERARATEWAQVGMAWRVWYAWVQARGGSLEQAWATLEAPRQSPLARPFVTIVEASIRLDANSLSDTDAFLHGAREYAQWARAGILRPHLDRLEAAMRLAEGEVKAAIAGLEHARAAFAEAGVIWEQARTELWLAEAHLAAGDPTAARALLATAREVAEGLGSVLEMERGSVLAARL